MGKQNYLDFLGAFQYLTDLQTVRLYQSTGGLQIFVMASEVIYFLFILYYMFVQVGWFLITIVKKVRQNYLHRRMHMNSASK